MINKKNLWVMPLLLLAITVFADSEVITDEDTGIEYRIIGSGARQKITVTGYSGDTSVLRIPATIENIPVTVIGEEAFEDKRLRSVTIPQGILEIQDQAFIDNFLTRISLPKGITLIGDEAFANNSITSVTIPEGVIDIGAETFAYNALTEVVLPQSLRTIGDGAFASTGGSAWGSSNQISSITFPENLVSIGERAFYRNKLSELVLPPGLKSVSDKAFDGNTITKISIGNNVALSNSAFNAEDEMAALLSSYGFVNVETDGKQPHASFPQTYADNHKKGGIYTLADDVWNYESYQ